MKQKFIEFARKHVKYCVGKNQHISLLVIRNKIICVGFSNYVKTHTYASYNNYKYAHIHSELSAICRFPWRQYDITKSTLINIRFAKANNGLLLSRPCHNCLNLIAGFNIKQVIFSTPTGFEKL